MSRILKTGSNIIPDLLLAEILLAMPGKSPAAARAAAMKKSTLERIARDAATNKDQAAAASTADSSMLIVREGEGDWITFAPNVAMKVLHDDGTTRSWLARFGPGGRIPAHMQSDDEEAIILDGWCYVDDVKFNRGDYHMIEQGKRHGNIHSPEGCLIFVRSHSATRHASALNSVR